MRLPTICAISNRSTIVELTGMGTGQTGYSNWSSSCHWHRRQREFRVRNCTSPQCGQERTSRDSDIAGRPSKMLAVGRFPCLVPRITKPGCDDRTMGEVVSLRGKAVLFDMDGTL